MYPGTDSHGIKLLERMLEFHPDKRITAAEAILDSYFDEIRLPEQERYEPPKIDLSIDENDCQDLTIQELKLKVHECLKNITSDTFDFQNDVEQEEY